MKKSVLNFVIAALVMAVLTACGSDNPEKDGVKAAQMACDGVNNSFVIMKKYYESYIKDFNSYSFKTRIEAREKLNETEQKAKEEIYENQRKEREYYDELKSKYNTNEEAVNKFEYAYNAQRNDFKPKEGINENIYEYKKIIENLILTIIPPKPDLEQLIADILKLKDFVYYKDGGGIASGSINPETFQEAKILETTDVGDDYKILFYLRARRFGQAAFNFEGNVTVTYRLAHLDYWSLGRIQTVESKASFGR